MKTLSKQTIHSPAVTHTTTHSVSLFDAAIVCNVFSLGLNAVDLFIDRVADSHIAPVPLCRHTVHSITNNCIQRYKLFTQSIANCSHVATNCSQSQIVHMQRLVNGQDIASQTMKTLTQHKLCKHRVSNHSDFVAQTMQTSCRNLYIHPVTTSLCTQFDIFYVFTVTKLQCSEHTHTHTHTHTNTHTNTHTHTHTHTHTCGFHLPLITYFT